MFLRMLAVYKNESCSYKITMNVVIKLEKSTNNETLLTVSELWDVHQVENSTKFEHFGKKPS